MTIALKKNVFQFGRQAPSRQFYLLAVLRTSVICKLMFSNRSPSKQLFFNCFAGARTSGVGRPQNRPILNLF